MDKIWRKMPAALAAGTAVLALRLCRQCERLAGARRREHWRGQRRRPGGVTMSTPIGSPTSPVSGTIGLGRGSGGWGWGSGVGVGVSIGGGTVLNRSDDNAPAETWPAPAGTPVQQAPAGVGSPVHRAARYSRQAQVVKRGARRLGLPQLALGRTRVSP